MGLFDFLGGVGTVASPGLEAYGRGQLDIANLIASLQNKRQERSFELAKLAEESRRFGITSDVSARTLAETMRANITKEKPNTLEELIVEEHQKTGKVSPGLQILWELEQNQNPLNQLIKQSTGLGAKGPEGPGILNKAWEEAKGLFSGGAEAGPAVPTVPTTSASVPTTLTTEPTDLTSGLTFPQWEQEILPEISKLPGVSAEDVIREVKQRFPHITDDDIKSRFSEMISAGSPQKGETGVGPALFAKKGLADRLVEGITYPSRRLERRTGYTIPSRTLGSTPRLRNG